MAKLSRCFGFIPPRESVWSRRISEGLKWSEVSEAFEACSIVVANEAVKEGVAILVRHEQAVSDAAFWLSAYGFDDAAIEALDQAVGLWPIGLGQAMINLVLSADTIERMPTGGPIERLVLHVDGEAICELAAIVGQDGMNLMGEVGEEAIEESCCGIAVAPWMDLQIDVSRGAIDSDKGIAPAALQCRQVLEIDVDEADGGLLEDADGGLVRLRPAAETMALEATMNGAARELGIDAAAHHFGDVVERQVQLGAQFADQRLLDRGEAGGQFLGDVRAIGDYRTPTPPPDRGFADTKLNRQVRDRLLTALNVSPDLWCGRGIGVQVQLHDRRRS
jgi:hypothetical protein